MLIVRTWVDFYDSVSAFGIDKTCVYNRKTEVVKSSRDSNWKERFFISPNKKKIIFKHLPVEERFLVYSIENVVVGFCGMLYPAVVINKNDKKTYCYSPSEVLNYFAKEKVNLRSFARRWYWNGDFSIKSEKGLNNFFDSNCWGGLLDVFSEFRVPCFLYSGINEKLTLNPKLKDLNFMKVKDPQTAFQDIYFYLSGVLGAPVEKTKPVDDKIKAATHGHDGPYSFKKPPGGKKWR